MIDPRIILRALVVFAMLLTTIALITIAAAGCRQQYEPAPDASCPPRITPVGGNYCADAGPESDR